MTKKEGWEIPEMNEMVDRIELKNSGANPLSPPRYGCAAGMVNEFKIDSLKKRTNGLEKKMDWLLYTMITTLLTVVMNMVIIVGG